MAMAIVKHAISSQLNRQPVINFPSSSIHYVQIYPTNCRLVFSSVRTSSKGTRPPCNYSPCRRLFKSNHDGHSRPLSSTSSKEIKDEAREISNTRSNDNNASIITKTTHQPPLPIRIALVGSSTALATPAFPALGFLYLTMRIRGLSNVHDPEIAHWRGRLGTWGSILSFAVWTLVPTLYSPAVTPLLLPCAVGNGLAAGGVYALMDLGGITASSAASSAASPYSQLLRTPGVLGGCIGGGVGYLAPHHLYGPLFEAMYGMVGMQTFLQQYILSMPLATEVSVMTGVAAGMALHPLLHYPIYGVEGVPWTRFSGVSLAAVLSALFYVYHYTSSSSNAADENDDGTIGLHVPKGSFIAPSQLPLAESILRYNAQSNAIETYSLHSQSFIGPPSKCLRGRSIAEDARNYSHSASNIPFFSSSYLSSLLGYRNRNDENTHNPTNNTKAIFDDRLLAFIYNYWDDESNQTTTLRYPQHIVTLSTAHNLQQCQDSLMLTDGSVAVLLHRYQIEKHQRQLQAVGEENPSCTITPRQVDDDDDNTHTVSSILHKMEQIDKSRIDGRDYSKYKLSYLNEDALCTTMESLMMLQAQHELLEDDHKEIGDANTTSRNDFYDQNITDVMADMETYIRARYPTIILYKRDEVYPDTSLQSQLHAMGWRLNYGNYDYDQILKQWNVIYNEDQKQSWRKRVIWNVCGGAGLLASLASTLWLLSR